MPGVAVAINFTAWKKSCQNYLLHFSRKMNEVKTTNGSDQHTDAYTAFGERISFLLFRHLKIYTGWSLANIIIGLPILILESGYLFYFVLMNFIWGVVNIGFAGLFYWHIHAQRFRKKSFDDQIKIQRHICKMLFINIALDCGYILTGIYILFLAEESDLRVMFMAFGMAIIFQGLFLLIQDMWFYGRYRRNLSEEKMSTGPQKNAMI